MKNVNTPPLLQWELGGSLSFTQSLTEKKKTHEDYRAEKDGNWNQKLNVGGEGRWILTSSEI